MFVFIFTEINMFMYVVNSNYSVPDLKCYDIQFDSNYLLENVYFVK